MTWDRTHILMKALIRDLMVCIVLALIFTFLGVYDSDNMVWPARAVFWTVIMCLGGITIFIVEPLIYGTLFKNQHPVIQVLVISAVISIPIAIFLVGLNTKFKFDWSVINWAMQYLTVIIISLLIVTGRYLISQFMGAKTKATPDDNMTGPADSFLERLPVKFRSAELLALSSEGHYLRVHTDRGSPLILMRISDAVRELSGADGLQTHRSWWVARTGIEETRRKSGRRSLVLKNGETAPVSRSFLPALKSANLDK